MKTIFIVPDDASLTEVYEVIKKEQREILNKLLLDEDDESRTGITKKARETAAIRKRTIEWVRMMLFTDTVVATQSEWDQWMLPTEGN